MEVKAVVAKAVTYIRELFEHENLTNIGLEEVYLDMQEGEWVVTVGFSRPWDYPKNAMAELAGKSVAPKRSFKEVRIHDTSENVISVRTWVPPSAADDLPF